MSLEFSSNNIITLVAQCPRFAYQFVAGRDGFDDLSSSAVRSSSTSEDGPENLQSCFHETARSDDNYVDDYVEDNDNNDNNRDKADKEATTPTTRMMLTTSTMKTTMTTATAASARPLRSVAGRGRCCSGVVPLIAIAAL
jgi:hypothetical protein